MKRRIPATSFALLALAALLRPAPAAATSYVMMSDATLASQAPLIAEVRVDAVEPAPVARPSTDYTVRVERLLKGYAAGSSIIVRVVGGVAPDGRGLKIWGAPAFHEGERALLFLVPRDDGTYGILQLMLGAFHVVTSGGQDLAVRDLREAVELGRAPGASAERLRDADAFAAWLGDRARGVERSPDYFVAATPARTSAVTDAFSFFVCHDTAICNGKNFRWFEFDGGGEVDWRFFAGGYDGSGAGRASFDRGLAAWNNEPNTPIRILDKGTTTSTSGFGGSGGNLDGINAILFNDPNNEVGGTFDCGQGGTIAIGGPEYQPSIVQTFNGKSYVPIVFADIVTNDGTECFFDADVKNADTTFAHELGHTLGLAHSNVPGALMQANIAQPAPGAKLQADDIAGIRVLYEPATVGGGNVPAAPTGLTATPLSDTAISLAWSDNSSNETAFKVESRTLDGSFAEIASLPAGTTLYSAVGLAPATAYVFRVRAAGSGGSSAYSNETTATTLGSGDPCAADASTLCLNGGRFQVSARFSSGAAAATTDDAAANPLTDDTGYFTFFDPANVELVVKVLEACSLEGFDNYWVFMSGLTNVQVLTTVIDTETREAHQYFNPLDTDFVLVKDTANFHVCATP